MSLINQQLRLTDSADTFKAARWKALDGTYYALASGRLTVRATETEDDTADPLLDYAAVIGTDGSGNPIARVTIPKADIVAADFEALANPAVWEFTLTRTTDNHTISVVGGSVVWSRGVAR